MAFGNRVESYSCKMAGNEKKLYKIMHSEEGKSPNDLQALSPPQTIISHSHSPNKGYRYWWLTFFPIKSYAYSVWFEFESEITDI